MAHKHEMKSDSILQCTVVKTPGTRHAWSWGLSPRKSHLAVKSWSIQVKMFKCWYVNNVCKLLQLLGTLSTRPLPRSLAPNPTGKFLAQTPRAITHQIKIIPSFVTAYLLLFAVRRNHCFDTAYRVGLKDYTRLSLMWSWGNCISWRWRLYNSMLAGQQREHLSDDVTLHQCPRPCSIIQSINTSIDEKAASWPDRPKDIVKWQ